MLESIDEIAKDLIPKCLASAEKDMKRQILGILGFEVDSWGEVKFKDNAGILNEILDLPETQKLRKDIINRVAERINTKIISDAFVNSMTKDIVDNVMHKLRYAVRADLEKELLEKITQQFKNHPEIAPALIAEKFIKRTYGKIQKTGDKDGSTK